jgi:hypothetical protein
MQFVKPQPFQEAIDKLGSKTPITSAFKSHEWKTVVPAGLRDRAFFSATVESARFLNTAQSFLKDFLEGNRGEAGELKAGSRAQFVKEFSELADRLGLGPLDPAQKGTVQDVTSQSRLSLIFDTQTQQAHDFGYWKQGQDPDVLNEFPAQRFIRVREVKVPRPYHQLNEGRVELKSNLEFWLSMNPDFGVPWGPWGFNSGMGVEDVDRDEAEALGLIAPGEQAQPVEKNFNERLEASSRGLTPEVVDTLKNAFGEQVEIDGDAVRWKKGATVIPSPMPVKTPSPKPEPPAVTSPSSLDEVLAKVGIADTATPEQMAQLLSELKEENPLPVTEKLLAINGAKRSGFLTEDNLRQKVSAFLSYLPPDKIKNHPKLTIEVKRMHELGYYAGKGVVALNSDVLGADPQGATKTLFHELMHWFHMEGSQEYKQRIKSHFQQRTLGEKVVQLHPYGPSTRGKTDKWYEVYAGRIYPWEVDPAGLEVPTRYIEWLTRDPALFAAAWNRSPEFRETMKVVLEGLF